MANGTHTLEVWGDFACFTRPEMKVERFSYPVITPSAARGIFDAIYWDGLRERQGRESIMRPYFHWQLIRIEVLELPRYIALRRNEVKDKVPADRTLKAWMEGREQPEPIWADGGKDELGTDQKGRTQRQTMALFEYALVPGGLKMRVTTSSTSHFGDKDLMVGGDPDAVVAEGVLQKLR